MRFLGNGDRNRVYFLFREGGSRVSDLFCFNVSRWRGYGKLFKVLVNCFFKLGSVEN